MEALGDLWDGLPAQGQDLVLLGALLLPAVLIGFAVLRGFRVWVMVGALLSRFAVTNLVFVLLMALSVGLGIALLAQERALRSGTARAAEKFDVVVTAPGDQIQMLLATVYLQPSDAPLLRGEVLARLQADDQIDLLAPIAFGDSHEGMPVVGTTGDFVMHLAGELAEGRIFAALDEGVAGALAPFGPGDSLTPMHGHGDFVEDAHEGTRIRITGRMAPTGTPWDRAVLVPVEAVFDTHGLSRGHHPDRADKIGPPFDPAYFPGVPAFVLHSAELYKNYAVRSRYATGKTMAFFPGAVLARLHALLGDVRGVMSLMAVLTQVLVAAGVLSGLVALVRLFARRFALLRALGAPRRYIMAVVWTYGGSLIGAGCVAGIGVGWVAAGAISRAVTARTDVALAVEPGFSEFHLVAAFFSLTNVLALLPAVTAYRRSVIDDLRRQ